MEVSEAPFKTILDQRSSSQRALMGNRDTTHILKCNSQPVMSPSFHKPSSWIIMKTGKFIEKIWLQRSKSVLNKCSKVS